MPETIIPLDWYSDLPIWLRVGIWYFDYYILAGALYVLAFIAVIIALIVAATLIGAPFFLFAALLKRGKGRSTKEADSEE